jgi:hypothetical protein
MAKKKKTAAQKRRKLWDGLDAAPCYYTLGRHVLLGRVSMRTRRNARAAGLIPVTAKNLQKMFGEMQAIRRMSTEGYWHDTVRY